jgi:predicted CopG family antitoxin
MRMKRVIIVIDEPLHEKSKEIAWQERKSLSELIRELLEKKINNK